MEERIKLYLKALDRELAHGRTTEHTHRPALKSFVESLGDAQGHPPIAVDEIDAVAPNWSAT